ncbi:hypothetical protein B1R94_04605 [Mycolicibacterium litorale]|nr:hypothetical protein B1R94_04605 [Mycolicibacterium litorale]
MAEQTAAVMPSAPPGVVMRVVNPLIRTVLGTPLAASLGKQFMVLNFTGRKSGRQFSVPVTAHWLDGSLYALMEAGWKVNFRGGAVAQVRHDGKTTAMRGELIEDRTAIAELFLRCASAYGPRKAQRMMGLKFRDDRMPTLEEFRTAVDEYGLAAVRFSPV